MDIHFFQTFLLVAKLSNISQAAKQLNFSQPAVTTQIQTLEDHFCVRLFERIGKKLYITEAGKQLVIESEKLLSLYEEIHKSMDFFSNQESLAKIGASTAAASYILSPILREFQDSQLKGPVIVDTCTNLPITIKGLLDNNFDLAIVHDKVNNGQLIQFELYSQKLVWVASSDLINNNNNIFDISCYPFINFRKGCVYRTKYEDFLEKIHIKPIIEYSDAEAIKQAVLDGVGIGVLPYVLVESFLANGTLVQFTNVPQLSFTLSVVFHKNKNLSPLMNSLLTIFAKHADIKNGLLEYLKSKL